MKPARRKRPTRPAPERGLFCTACLGLGQTLRPGWLEAFNRCGLGLRYENCSACHGTGKAVR